LPGPFVRAAKCCGPTELTACCALSVFLRGFLLSGMCPILVRYGRRKLCEGKMQIARVHQSCKATDLHRTCWENSVTIFEQTLVPATINLGAWALSSSGVTGPPIYVTYWILYGQRPRQYPGKFASPADKPSNNDTIVFCADVDSQPRLRRLPS
jgi:hypothetical protein